MNLNQIETVYFLGIGGIGMSALARYFKSLGKEVSGYDKTSTNLTKELSSEGIFIHYDDDIKYVKESINNYEKCLIIYTPAIPKTNQIYSFLDSNKIQIYKRAEVLGIISKSTFTIAVAGTHGKTTTSSLVAHLLHSNNINFTAFLGGLSTNFNSNYVNYNEGIELFDSPITVVEADEYDRSFLFLSPNILIVTSTDADHLDIYGQSEEVKKSFQDFVNLLQLNGVAIIKEGLELVSDKKMITYGTLNSDAKYSNIKVIKHQFEFEFNYNNYYFKTTSGLPGIHNIENATAATLVGLELNLEISNIALSIEKFKGVKRRFEIIYKDEISIYLDDYAHHPSELKAIINSVKLLYPNEEIVGVFQPHLFTRTRDFIDDFALSLSLLNQCYLLDIYPARELPIEGVNSNLLASKMTNKVSVETFDSVKEKIRINKPSVLITLGAGDIDLLVEPFKNIYEN